MFFFWFSQYLGNEICGSTLWFILSSDYLGLILKQNINITKRRIVFSGSRWGQLPFCKLYITRLLGFNFNSSLDFNVYAIVPTILWKVNLIFVYTIWCPTQRSLKQSWDVEEFLKEKIE